MLSLILSLQATHTNVDKKGLALQGYDPVSYFSTGATEGSSAFAHTYQGATYYFVSEENKNAFISDPERYIPQYGGWCAYAMGLGPEKVKVNPERYKVVDGKLFLFYDFRGNNTLPPWNENEVKLMQQADDNWKKIIR